MRPPRVDYRSWRSNELLWACPPWRPATLPGPAAQRLALRLASIAFLIASASALVLIAADSL